MYVTLGSGNGGIILNLGVGGLAFQAAGKLNQEQDLTLQFKLPGSREAINAGGQVAWLGPTRKEAGIRFTGLPPTVEQTIAEWIAKQEGSASAASELQPNPTPISAQQGHSVPSRPVSAPLVNFPVPASRLPPIPAGADSDGAWEDDGWPAEISAGSDAPRAASVSATFARQPEITSDVSLGLPKDSSLNAADYVARGQHQRASAPLPSTDRALHQRVSSTKEALRVSLRQVLENVLTQMLGLQKMKRSPTQTIDGESKPYFFSEIRGTWYWNADGSIRQRIISSCKVGEELRLLPELDRFGLSAVKICRANGEQLGYWEEDAAKTESLSRAGNYRVTIAEIYVFREDPQKKGVRLRIEVFD
jgi:PilZ domain